MVEFAALTTQSGSSMMAPAELPTSGGERALGVWGIAGMLVLGLILVAGGLLLKRNVSSVTVRH